MRVLICGSRKWPAEAWQEAVVWLTERIDALWEGTIVIHGGAHGVDQAAAGLAVRRGLFDARVPVGPQHYKRHGKKAPILRDRAMLDLLRPGDLVIAAQYAGSRGTQYTVDEARRRGIEVEVRCWLPVAGSVS